MADIEEGEGKVEVMTGKSKRGFAAMDPSKQREIASKGGKAAHQKGTAHQFTPDEARSAGKKGGEAVSKDRQHMASIGRQGGEAVSRDREHMSRIGREGGEARASRAGSERRMKEAAPASSSDEEKSDEGEASSRGKKEDAAE